MKENPNLLNWFNFFADLHEHFKNKAIHPFSTGEKMNIELTFIRVIKEFREISEKVEQILQIIDPTYKSTENAIKRQISIKNAMTAGRSQNSENKNISPKHIPETEILIRKNSKNPKIEEIIEIPEFSEEIKNSTEKAIEITKNNKNNEISESEDFQVGDSSEERPGNKLGKFE